LKLLFDQNLSPRLVATLADLYPGSLHVREAGLREADDSVVWHYAREQGLTIVSKDSDFHQLSFVHGHPPKVVWLRVGNGPTTAIAALLRTQRETVQRFHADPEAAFLALAPRS
jgi:predicted nuclease of predicted toxin-antitoxin system